MQKKKRREEGRGERVQKENEGKWLEKEKRQIIMLLPPLSPTIPTTNNYYCNNYLFTKGLTNRNTRID